MKTPDQTVARWSALYMIADAPLGLTQTQLAERMGVQGPTLVRLIDALEKASLVSRQPATHDRRAKIVSLTDEGRAVLAQIDRSAAEMRDELFTGFTDTELETTLRVLKHVSQQLEAVPPAK
jgi:MarR family transcriptional regulator, transcriptional regulator for hemolysin